MGSVLMAVLLKDDFDVRMLLGKVDHFLGVVDESEFRSPFLTRVPGLAVIRNYSGAASLPVSLDFRAEPCGIETDGTEVPRVFDPEVGDTVVRVGATHGLEDNALLFPGVHEH